MASCPAIISRRTTAFRFMVRGDQAAALQTIPPAIGTMARWRPVSGFFFPLNWPDWRRTRLRARSSTHTSCCCRRPAISTSMQANQKPPLHLSSLGIAEQFYLAWPLALWLTPHRWRRAMIAIVLTGSFALNVAFVKTHPQATFHLPSTRAWELLAGAPLVGVAVPKAASLAESFSRIRLLPRSAGSATRFILALAASGFSARPPVPSPHDHRRRPVGHCGDTACLADLWSH
jgi:hypothetical protein